MQEIKERVVKIDQPHIITGSKKQTRFKRDNLQIQSRETRASKKIELGSGAYEEFSADRF